ncbi:MAG: queuosine precursor transporter [Candidatus Protochlamydia sp.]|nr:queuosine precursor transporter [Candidatus Protochlamydia sp.]
MNELLFLFQILLIIIFALAAIRLGKSALIAWIAAQALIANLFVLKQISLFGFNVTASDAFAIGGLLGLNFLQEYFGKEEAQKSTWICFFLMSFFVLVSQIHLNFIPSLYDDTQPSFLRILSPSPRLLASSMLVFIIVQRLDIYFFAALKKMRPQMNFTFRAAICLVISQFLDTLLFSLIGLYGLVASLVDIILLSFMIKLIVIFLFTPFIRWAKI